MENPYVWLTIFVFIFITALFFNGKFSSSKKQHSLLNLRAPDSGPILTNPQSAISNEIKEARRGSENMNIINDNNSKIDLKNISKIQTESSIENNSKNIEKDQIYFNYNDHSWEAHEVLGVRPGTEISHVTAAYQLSIRRASKGNLQFLETAYMAILKNKK